METLQQPYIATGFQIEKKESVIKRFMNWCGSQEEYRIGWLAIIVGGHGCFITPFTLLFVMLAGNSPVFWGIAIAAMAMPLVTNLAALPTRITIPVFLLSLFMDAVVIINCIALGLHILPSA